MLVCMIVTKSKESVIYPPPPTRISTTCRCVELCFTSLCFTSLFSFASVSLASFGILVFYAIGDVRGKYDSRLIYSSKSTLPVLLYRGIATDVLPALSRPPNQTAVNHSQGCPGNVTMENSCEFPCAKGFGGSKRSAEVVSSLPNLNQRLKQPSEATHEHRGHKKISGEIYGKPLTPLNASVLYLCLHLSPVPKERGLPKYSQS